MKLLRGLLMAGLLAAAALAGFSAYAGKEKKMDARVFELRTYHVHPGKMNALHARFRDHTCKLFEKHGMTLVGFWSPLDRADADQRMIYVLAFPSKEAADKSWKAFRTDPAWIKARDASEVNGPLVKKVDSVYMKATDYSPMK